MHYIISYGNIILIKKYINHDKDINSFFKLFKAFKLLFNDFRYKYINFNCNYFL